MDCCLSWSVLLVSVVGQCCWSVLLVSVVGQCCWSHSFLSTKSFYGFVCLCVFCCFVKHIKIYVEWIGDKVAHLDRAKARELLPTLRRSIDQALTTPIAAEIEAQSLEHIAFSALLHKWSGYRQRATTEAPVPVQQKPEQFSGFGKQRKALK